MVTKASEPRMRVLPLAAAVAVAAAASQQTGY